MDCNCPAPTELTEIPNVNCPVDLKQIQRLGFQRIGYTFDATATPPTDILDLSVWQALKTASDDTKVVLTPLIGGDPVIEPGEAITSGGGDNSTLNGIEENEGTNPSAFSCVFKSLPSEAEKAIKALKCEKQLTVYLFLQGGRLAVTKIDTDKITGFNALSLFVSDRGNQGFGTKDTVSMSFSLEAGWSDNLQILKPNFNPFVDL